MVGFSDGLLYKMVVEVFEVSLELCMRVEGLCFNDPVVALAVNRQHSLERRWRKV